MALKLKKTVKQLCDEANAEVETVKVADALTMKNDPNVQFVDIRDIRELDRDGRVPGAVHAPRGMLEFYADPTSPYHRAEFDPGRRTVLYCASGGRSALAAQSLRQMGYGNVAHLDGGIKAWAASGRDVARD